MSLDLNESGFSLVEVMVASVIAGVSLMGMMGIMEMASRQVQQGSLSTHALALAQARLEVKRSVRWQDLLEDDLDHDGVLETFMNDNGEGGDQIAGDGVYTAKQQVGDVTLVWNVEADRQLPLKASAMVTIHATASYVVLGTLQEVRLATFRANPTYVGR